MHGFSRAAGERVKSCFFLELYLYIECPVHSINLLCFLCFSDFPIFIWNTYCLLLFKCTSSHITSMLKNPQCLCIALTIKATFKTWLPRLFRIQPLPTSPASSPSLLSATHNLQSCHMDIKVPNAPWSPMSFLRSHCSFGPDHPSPSPLSEGLAPIHPSAQLPPLQVPKNFSWRVHLGQKLGFPVGISSA